MGKGRNGRHRQAKLTVRAELTMSNSELEFLLHEANAELTELRAHQQADRRDLERLRSESGGLDLDRLARVLRGALDRIRQREKMLMQVTEAYSDAREREAWTQHALEGMRREKGNLTEELRQEKRQSDLLVQEVTALKRLAEERRAAAEEAGALRIAMSRLARERDEAERAKLQAQLDLERLRAVRGATPTIGKKEWRLLAQLVHPDVHVEERKGRANEAMQLLNTSLRPS
jgi:hypothetical protein